MFIWFKSAKIFVFENDYWRLLLFDRGQIVKIRGSDCRNSRFNLEVVPLTEHKVENVVGY